MSKLKVSNEIHLLGAITIVAFLFCTYGLVNLLLIQNKPAITIGIITSYTTAVPSMTAFHDSKWVQLTYKTNGKQYVSQKSIQVPLPSEIGSTVQLRYDTQHPERLYSFTLARILISLGVAAVCIVAVVFRLV